MGAARLIMHLSNSSAYSCEIVASAEPVGSANSRCPAADSNFTVSVFAAHRRSAAAALRIFITMVTQLPERSWSKVIFEIEILSRQLRAVAMATVIVSIAA